ncbi:MAG: DUF697 domain-containing protein [Prochlorococcus sp.]|jgi:hypothetical protein
MNHTPSTPERCRLLLSQWHSQLSLNQRENHQLTGELLALNRQLKRLEQRRLRIAVFGRVGVGKSSLLNALLGEDFFATDVAHGSTRHQQAVDWCQPINNLDSVELVDTPGIDEIAAAGRARLAARVAMQADLVLLILDSDLTSVEAAALKTLLKSGRPVMLVLNRCDCLSLEQRNALLASIRRRLPAAARQLQLLAVAAAPRKAQLRADGRIRSNTCPPQIESLRKTLINLLTEQGELLLALNALRQADRFYQALKRGRLQRSKAAAQGLIGRFAAIKASGVAVNPLVLLDLAGGLACDTALVMQLCQLYGLQIGGPAARQLLSRLSGHNALLGGAQLGIQLALGAVRQLLVLAVPFTGGLSLAPAAPVALAQAALAVHTTQRTGRLTAREILRSSQRHQAQPGALLRRLAASDPQVRRWLVDWPEITANEPRQLQALLP